MDEKIDLLDSNFNKSSWFNSINIGWEGGVHIQSCGHYLHLDCHCSYMQSLKASRLRNRNNSDNGEFSCPLCRQMGNSVLPINPDLNKKTNLKSYHKQIRQFNLKKQDFSSVNKHVAKMFELLANLNNDNDDEELMTENDEETNLANTTNENRTAVIGENNTFNNTATTGVVENSDTAVVAVLPSQSTTISNNLKGIEFNLNLASSSAELNEQCTVVDSPNTNNAKFFSTTSASNSSSPKSSLPFSSIENTYKETCLELMSLYTRIPTPDSNLLKSFGFFCEDLTKATGPQYRSVKTSPTPHALYLFMCSILRTNLETELLVKLSKSAATGAKKSCFGMYFVLVVLTRFN